jgi:hypothetical protein
MLDEINADAAAGTRNPTFYGFTSFSYWHPLMNRSNPWLAVVKPEPTFYAGDVNLYVDAALGGRWGSLVEVSFMFAPGGTYADKPDLSRTLVDTTVRTDFGDRRRWGGVAIERAWIEYVAHAALTVRAGLWLTPYGIWNVDHGAPTIIGVRRPFMMQEELFPERQAGIELQGARAVGPFGVGYHLTLSNGRGPADATVDLDGNRAIGGRLFVDGSMLGDWRAGVSLYRGRYTSTTGRWMADADGVFTLDRRTETQYDETSLAGDLRWKWRGLYLQAEANWNERTHVDPHRPVGTTIPVTRYAPDFRRFGLFALAGYRFAWLGLMPYLSLEDYHAGEGSLPFQFGHLPRLRPFMAGLNARPHPAVVIKLEAVHGSFPGATGWGSRSIRGLWSQVAWVF